MTLSRVQIQVMLRILRAWPNGSAFVKGPSTVPARKLCELGLAKISKLGVFNGAYYVPTELGLRWGRVNRHLADEPLLRGPEVLS